MIALAAMLLATATATKPATPSNLRDVAVIAAGYDPDRRAAAHRLIDASGFRNRQVAIARDSWQSARALRLSDCIEKAAQGRKFDCASTPAQDAKIKAIIVAEQERTLDTLCEAAETLYAERFTANEMDQLSAFFQSDIGRKYGTAYPGILGKFQDVKEKILLRILDDAQAKAAGAGSKP